MENPEYKKWLKRLTQAVDKALDAIDEEMKKPSSNERGKRIAQICNFLNLENDAAKHFGLGMSLKSREEPTDA